LLHMVSILVSKNQTKTRSDFWGVKLGLRRKTLYNKKKQGWEPIHNKYKANRSSKTQVTKAHNNQDTTSTLRK